MAKYCLECKQNVEPVRPTTSWLGTFLCLLLGGVLSTISIFIGIFFLVLGGIFFALNVILVLVRMTYPDKCPQCGCTSLETPRRSSDGKPIVVDKSPAQWW